MKREEATRKSDRRQIERGEGENECFVRQDEAMKQTAVSVVAVADEGDRVRPVLKHAPLRR